MQKIALTTLVTCLILAGCGGGSSGSTSNAQPAAAVASIDANNALKIVTEAGILRGEVFEKTIKLNADNTSVKFYATDNDPVSYLEIYPKNGAVTPIGWITLDNNNLQAAIKFLATPKDTQRALVLLCEDVYLCSQNSRYVLRRNQNQYELNLNFEQARQLWNATLPDYFYPEEHYFAFNGDEDTGEADLHYQFSSPVKVFGQLKYTIPSEWVVMQAKRFPEVAVVGQLTINGDTYQVKNIGAGLLYNNKARILQLKNKEGKQLTLMFADDASNTSPQRVTYITLIDGDKSYGGVATSRDGNITEDAQWIKLNMENFVLFSSSSIVTKKLSATLSVPKVQAQLSWNNQQLALNELNNTLHAFARNEQKSYQLRFTVQQKDHRLTITHEPKGHLSVQYVADKVSYGCGSATEACPGLSGDADQKTYHVNQVKLGSNVLNGILFVPGVY